MPSPSELRTYAVLRDPESPERSPEGYAATIRWHSEWGYAFGSALVPSIQIQPGSNELVLRVRNVGVRRPNADQVAASFSLFDPFPTEAVARTALMAWPQTADWYLLFLIFKGPNPHYRALVNTMNGHPAGSRLPWTGADPPTDSEAREAIAWYLREREEKILGGGVGVIRR